MGRLIDWNPTEGDPSVARQFWLVCTHGVADVMRTAAYYAFVEPVQALRAWWMWRGDVSVTLTETGRQEAS